MNDLVSYKKLLEKNGYRFTTSKRTVLEVILNSETHLNVKEIYEKIKEKHIGLATIYRALKTFKQLGIVKEINIKSVSYYEMKIYSRKPLHIHFQCTKCNSIIDIDSQSLNSDYLKLNKRVEDENNLKIYDLDIMFIGLCSKCRGDLKCQDQQNLEE